jgi:hypothetical protein
VDALASGGSYLTLKRAWKDGDHVEMEMPMRLHIEAMPDEPQTQAILYGPLVLAGDLGSEGLKPQMIEGDEGPNVKDFRMTVPTFRAAGDGPEAWIKPGEKPLTFRTTGQARDVSFEPFYRIFGKRYSVYWTVNV